MMVVRAKRRVEKENFRRFPPSRPDVESNDRSQPTEVEGRP